MNFWDTSALVPLLARERATTAAQALYRADPIVLVAWTTMVECASAVARLEREGDIDSTDAAEMFARLDDLARFWREVEPVAGVRDIARRLLRAHPLRSADAVQLASAIVASQHQPRSLSFVTLDSRLELIARREGFTVVRPA